MLLAGAALGKRVGDTMADFQVVKWQSAETMKLEDFKGRIVILLFFNPYQEQFTREPAKVLQQQVLDYYEGRGGNADGIPVTLLSLNIYPVGGEAQTNRIISYAGLKQVAIDDATKATSALQQLDYDLLPLAVILNGVEDSPSHKLWEIVHMDEDFGTSRVNSFRTKVDSIRAPANDPPVVNTFSVDPVFEGEKGMLNWSVTGATVFIAVFTFVGTRFIHEGLNSSTLARKMR